MGRINTTALFRAGMFFMIMMFNSRQHKILLRCQAFASVTFRYDKRHSRIRFSSRFNYKCFDPLAIRGGGLSGSEETTRLLSTTSFSTNPSSFSEKDQFEKRVIESLRIASGGRNMTQLKSFGGLMYQDTSSPNTSSSFRVVFVLGGPGAGKGTQCELLIKNYPCHHLSAGQLLRDEAKKKDGSSEHADLIEECLIAGKIVPVEISLSLLQNAMHETEGNDSLIFLIDGFPRNFDNLDGWTRCMTSPNGSTDAAAVWGVLSYDCPLSILEERVMKRSKDSGRSDDNLESLRRRFKTFQSETLPVVDTLRAIDQKTSSSLKVVDIEGKRSLNEVWEETQKSMNLFIANDVLSANMRLLQAIANKDIDTYRALSADEMFAETGDSTKQNDLTVMEAQETERNNQFGEINIEDSKITFITGKKVSVSYKRMSDSGITFQETRIWSHHGAKGWRQVHFYRTG